MPYQIWLQLDGRPKLRAKPKRAWMAKDKRYLDLSRMRECGMERCEVMREIRFRGKRAHNGKWVYGCFAEFVNYLDGDTKPGIQVTNQVPSGFDRMIPAFETELVEVIPETVGQYTGLHDKNGVEIYEGDVVRADMDFGPGGYAEQIASIYWDEGVGGWQFNYFDKTTIEIIGNIYDNPELMEVEE